MMKTLAALSMIVGVVIGPNLSAQNAPIDNSKRPGAGAPNCAKLVETTDKCVFHTRKGQVDVVRLPVAAGVSWQATVSNASLVAIGDSKIETLPDGKQQQTIQVMPQTADDADVVLKLEKRSNTASAATETRSINLMIHALTTS